MTAPEMVSTLGHASIAVMRVDGAHTRDAQCEDGPHASGTEVVHDHASLSLCLSGSRRFWMRHEYRIARGDLLLVPEGMPHYGEDISQLQLVGIALCTHCMRDIWGDALRAAFAEVRRGAVAVRRLNDDALHRFDSVAQRLQHELAEERAHQDLMISGLMSELAAEVMRAAPAEVRKDVEDSFPEAVTAALDFIEHHARDGISLAEVAAAVGRSPTYLTSLVGTHTGRTVVEWITHSRMSIARHMLRATEEQIAVIGEAVGYASPSHFHRTFRREHQLTPAQWRRGHRSVDGI